MKKAFLFILFILVLAGCNARSSENVVQQADSTYNVYNSITMYIDSCITNVPNKMTIKNDTVKIEKSDSTGGRIIELYSKLKEDEDYRLEMTYYLPLKEQGFIIGDLNNDGEKDVIAPVTEDGGGNVIPTKYYIFYLKHGHIQFFKIYDDFELGGIAGPDENSVGQFSLAEIKDNYLIGSTYIWTSEDAHCCPSLHYNVKISIANGLKLIDKTIIKDK